jgi:hypothetical protein
MEHNISFQEKKPFLNTKISKIPNIVIIAFTPAGMYLRLTFGQGKRPPVREPEVFAEDGAVRH